MSESSGITRRTIEFTASDGASLTGDLALPEAPRAASIVCHPHPQYGGTRFDHVVGAVHEALPLVGIASLRFDFRSRFADGVGERLDAVAALTEVERAVPAAGALPRFAVGYSFGAWIALGLDDARVAGIVAVAPPLAVMAPTAVPTVPTLVLTPAHDQFSPPAASERVIAGWRSASAASIDHETVEMADHFLAGRTTVVAERTVDWLTARIADRR